MNGLSMHNFSTDFIPGESFLYDNLQKPLTFTINNKAVKRGRLILYKRIHFYIQLTILTEDNQKENFEVPIPFVTENYTEEGLLYYDYRLTSLRLNTKINTNKKISSTYYNKILEISNVKS